MPRIVILDNTNLSPFAEMVVKSLFTDLRGRAGFDSIFDHLDEVSDLQSRWCVLINQALSKHLLTPEDCAMLQALYSRSPKSVMEHLLKVQEVGSGKFMDNFYVGYGHASIGDCGSTTIFIEGVSMLVAKAIQDNPLYSGQEHSTRYKDFSNATFDNPFGSDAGLEIQHGWMNFYLHTFERLIEYLRAENPRLVDEEEKVYENAIKARAFDILRAFLPAGTHTNLSWHTNLRQARDKLRWMIAHPDINNIATVAADITTALREKYPHSGFDMSKMSNEELHYRRKVMHQFAYVDEEVSLPADGRSRVHVRSNIAIQQVIGHDISDLLRSRPEKIGIPPMLAGVGTLNSKFLLDFGSFRDLQRHRNGYMRMPLLTLRYGFHPWYFEQLPLSLRKEAHRVVDQQVERIRALPDKPILRQAYLGMGFRVACEVTQTLPAWVYRVELRSQQGVHPTLRAVVQEEAQQFNQWFGDMIPLHVDMSPDKWSTRRGKQTIEAR